MADVTLRSAVGATAIRTIPAARATGAVTVWIQPRHFGLRVSSSAMRAAASSTAVGSAFEGYGAPDPPSGALLFMSSRITYGSVSYSPVMRVFGDADGPSRRVSGRSRARGCRLRAVA